MDFLNEVGTRGIFDSLTLNSSTTEDLTVSVGLTAITVWEKKKPLTCQMLKYPATVKTYPPLFVTTKD